MAVPLDDSYWAVSELEWALHKGVIVMRTAPALAPGGGTRSPGDAVYHLLWALCAEAGIVVAFRSGDTGYGRCMDDWEPTEPFQAFRLSQRTMMTSDRAPFHMHTVLACHGVPSRHPRVKLASIEAGCDWVAPPMRLKEAWRQRSSWFASDPVEQLREHQWVAPFSHDGIAGPAEAIGVQPFGSDDPHAEGLADPAMLRSDLAGLPDARRTMRDSALALLGS